MWLDFIIMLIATLAVYRNWGSGMARQICGSVGFFGGLLIGRVIDPHIVTLIHSTTGRAIMTLVLILGLALAGLVTGEYAGLHLKRRLLKRRFNDIDNTLGSLLTAGLAFFIIWLTISITGSLASRSLAVQESLRSSRIVAGTNRLLPPASNLVADLTRLIDPNSFPEVFIGNEPIPRGDINVPELGDLAKVVNKDKVSVLRIQGRGCGGLVSGSGFVVGDGLVATAAHVVAGIKEPYATDSKGRHDASVILFNPDLDLAVLRVDNLAGPPLSLNTSIAAQGTTGAVLGYPGGGKFNAGPAAVLDQFPASGHDIYGNGTSVREIYSLKASVISGNSGGPLIGSDGQVIGMLFAESSNFQQLSYALTAEAIMPDINRAAGNQQPTSTGQCAD